jgi:hypothetical protein
MQKQILLIKHPPCSPDLALCDFLLFPTISLLRGMNFGPLEVVQQHISHTVKAISESVLEMLPNVAEKNSFIIVAKGNYFE